MGRDREAESDTERCREEKQREEERREEIER